MTSVSYDLNIDPYETEDFSKQNLDFKKMADRLLEIHNQGYSRRLNLPKTKT